MVPPIEAQILHYARTYGIPPWQFERDCTQEWWEWIGAYESAYAEAMKKQ